MSELVGYLNHVVLELETGNLQASDLSEAIEKVRALEERLIILQYKAVEELVKPEKAQAVPAARITPKEPEAPAPVEEPLKMVFDFPEVKPIGNEETSTSDDGEQEDEVIIDRNQTNLLDAIEEIRSTGNPSLNEKIREANIPSLAAKHQLTKIHDLNKAFGINKRILFTQQLFRDNAKEFKGAVSELNSFSSFAEAKLHLDKNLAAKYAWDMESKAVLDFYTLVERRYV